MDGEESTVKTGPHSLSAATVFPDTQGHSHNMATTDCHLQASCLLSPIVKFMTKDTGNPKEKRERPPAQHTYSRNDRYSFTDLGVVGPSVTDLVQSGLLLCAH